MTAGLHRANAAEAPVIAALHEACLGEAWQVDSVARLMALPGAFAFVATDGEPPEPVGFILCVPSAPMVDVAAIGVLPRQRRSGVGGRLLDAAIESARGARAAALMLEVADDNPEALALYRGRGFTRAGVRRAYYRRPDGRRDAVVLRRSLLVDANSGDCL